jgi:hypothetical protein
MSVSRDSESVSILTASSRVISALAGKTRTMIGTTRASSSSRLRKSLGP